MRRHITSWICCLASLAMTAAPALASVGSDAAAPAKAQARTDVSGWADGPAGFLLTKHERKEWQKLTTDTEREHFIELFWARRNPDPEQPFNVFKAQFESRVRYADEHFSHSGMRGALTDRGHVLILLGPPQHAEHRAPTETVRSTTVGSTGTLDNRATDEVRAHAELWEYDPQRLPEGFKIRGSRLTFVFYEERAETDRYVLDRSHPEAPLALRALAEAPDVYLLHPNLDSVPKPVSVPGGHPASPAELAWLDGTSGPFTSQLQAVAEPGLAGADGRPLWVDLELPAAAPALDELTGRVSAVGGEVLSTFSIGATPLEAGDHRAYHLTFPLAPGTYRVDIVGVAAGEPVASYSVESEIPELPVQGTWLSPVWVGAGSQVEESASLGEAFCFGRLHLMPLLPDSEVKHSSELTFLGFAVRPALGADGTPGLEAKVTLTKDGKKLGRPLVMPLEGVKLTDEVWVYMSGINLAGLPGAGTYGLGFVVTDKAGTAASEERTVEIKVVD